MCCVCLTVWAAFFEQRIGLGRVVCAEFVLIVRALKWKPNRNELSRLLNEGKMLTGTFFRSPLLTGPQQHGY